MNINQHYYLGSDKKGFTLVELIVVVTIVAILATVGFVAYSNYLISARDGNRIAQISRVSEALIQYNTQGRLPLPENNVRLINGLDGAGEENIFGYQGSLGQTVLQTIGYSNDVIDPRDNSLFTYLVTFSRNNFQILSHLEDSRNIQSTVNQTNARLQNRYIRVFGERLGALVEADTLIPIEQLDIEVFDLSQPSSERFRAYISDDEFVEGTASELQQLDEVMRDRGRGWMVENNSFTCFDPEGVFPCSLLVGGPTTGGGGGPTPSPDPEPDPTPVPGPTPGPAGADDPELLFSFTPTNNSMSLSSSPSSSQFNTFNKQSGHGGFDVTLELGNSNNTVNLGQGNDTIIAGWGNNHITTTNSGNRTITVGDGYNFIRLSSGSHNITIGDGDNTIELPDSGNHSITGGNGNNTITATGVLDIELGNGNNEINITNWGNHTLEVGDGNNNIVIAGTNNGNILLGNGINEISITGSPSIITGTTGSATINFGNQTSRTTTWRGGDLTINGYHQWNDVVNVSHITTLDDCNDVLNDIVYSNGNQTGTLTTPQGTLVMNWSGSYTFNCSRVNQRFQF